MSKFLMLFCGLFILASCGNFIDCYNQGDQAIFDKTCAKFGAQATFSDFAEQKYQSATATYEGSYYIVDEANEKAITINVDFKNHTITGEDNGFRIEGYFHNEDFRPYDIIYGNVIMYDYPNPYASIKNGLISTNCNCLHAQFSNDDFSGGFEATIRP